MNEYTLETHQSPVPPDFDDERTVLTARRVVPLEKINARVKHRRQWFLGGAFALAMLLGAATALVASYLRLRSAAATVASLPVTQDVVTETQAAENIEEPSLTSAEEPKKEPIVKHKTIARRPTELEQPSNLPKVSEDEDLQHIREAVLYDQWQERRGRRVTRPERRNRADHHDRDLSNLDEIFEGRKRPY